MSFGVTLYRRTCEHCGHEVQVYNWDGMTYNCAPMFVEAGFYDVMKYGMKEKKTYTDKDLKPVPAAPADAEAADTAADGTKADAAEPKDGASAVADAKADAKKPKADDEVKDEEYWSKRMEAARAQLERDETFLSAMQNRIDSLTTDFVNRDDPAQKNLIATDRQKALTELDRLKKAVEEDKKAIPALEEEARREGVPAGWLR